MDEAHLGLTEQVIGALRHIADSTTPSLQTFVRNLEAALARLKMVAQSPSEALTTNPPVVPTAVPPDAPQPDHSPDEHV